MKVLFRWNDLASAFVSLLLLMAGGALIGIKLSDGSSIQEDQILTVEEQRALPANVMPVVIMRTPWYDEQSLPYIVLQLVLSRSGERYALGYAAKPLDEIKANQHLAASVGPTRSNPHGLTVAMFGAMDIHFPGVVGIPFPADGGLLGLRLLCVNARDQARFSSVESLDGLRPYLGVQGLGWTDADVLADNGLPVYEVASGSYLSLLDQDRVDYLPRGLVSVEEECGKGSREAGFSHISIDPTLLIAYPNAFIFVVNEKNSRLKAALERGFERAMADGSLQRLLQARFFTPWLKRHLRMRERRMLVLSTPATTAVLNQIPSSAWMVPWSRIPKNKVNGPSLPASLLCKEPFFAPLC
jgi:ABC-type amino acid transport substrate-binding protein